MTTTNNTPNRYLPDDMPPAYPDAPSDFCRKCHDDIATINGYCDVCYTPDLEVEAKPIGLTLTNEGGAWMVAGNLTEGGIAYLEEDGHTINYYGGSLIACIGSTRGRGKLTRAAAEAYVAAVLGA